MVFLPPGTTFHIPETSRSITSRTKRRRVSLFLSPLLPLVPPLLISCPFSFLVNQRIQRSSSSLNPTSQSNSNPLPRPFRPSSLCRRRQDFRLLRPPANPKNESTKVSSSRSPSHLSSPHPSPRRNQTQNDSRLTNSSNAGTALPRVCRPLPVRSSSELVGRVREGAAGGGAGRGGIW